MKKLGLVTYPPNYWSPPKLMIFPPNVNQNYFLHLRINKMAFRCLCNKFGNRRLHFRGDYAILGIRPNRIGMEVSHVI